MDSKRLQMIEMLHKIASLKNESECMLSCGYLFATPWTVAHQAPLFMEFPRQECWSGCQPLLQAIFLTQGSNPGLLHYRQILYHLNHQGKLI